MLVWQLHVKFDGRFHKIVVVAENPTIQDLLSEALSYAPLRLPDGTGLEDLRLRLPGGVSVEEAWDIDSPGAHEIPLSALLQKVETLTPTQNLQESAFDILVAGILFLLFNHSMISV